MTEHETGEALQPPQKSSGQFVEELVERFAVDVQNDNEDHRQYVSQYPLPEGSLGLASIGNPDVAFEKYIDMDADGAESNISYSIYIGCGSDAVLAIKSVDGELYGGYGESGLAGEDEIDPDDVRHLLTKLAAEMWLYENGLSAHDLDKEAVAKTVQATVKSLAPLATDDTEVTYPIEGNEHLWTALKVERWWAEHGEDPYCRLSLMGGDTMIVEVSLQEETGHLSVGNYSGADAFEGDAATQRIRIIFAAIAEAVAAGRIPAIEFID